MKDGREFSFVAPAGKNSPGDEFEVEYDSKSFHDHLSGFADTLHGHIVRHGSAVIDFGDMMILGMAFPNLVGVIMLSGMVRRDLDDYMRRLRSGEFVRTDVASTGVVERA